MSMHVIPKLSMHVIPSIKGMLYILKIGLLGVNRESIPFWCEFHTFVLTVRRNIHSRLEKHIAIDL